MIKQIVKVFVKNCENVTDKNVREAYGVLGGILGIICNVILFITKFIIGVIMNSIAIISDAFNNLSDMCSSLIAIVGAKMSNRHADKEHPFGHGRMEYVASLIVSFVIVMVGIELFRTSFNKILNPEPVTFSWVMVGILIVSMSIKAWMFLYNTYIAKKINSSIMKATAFDSLNDVLATGAVVVSTIIGRYISIPIDGFMGAIVSGFIMYGGFKIAKEITGLILGTPPSKELVENITNMVLLGEDIVGVHDLIIHDYGPGRIIASVHAEVPDDVNIVKVHEVIDKIEQEVSEKLDVHLVIHMDPISVNCERTNEIKALITEIVTSVNKKFTIHDFRMTDGEKNINLIFDLVVPIEMNADERKEAERLIKQKLFDIDSKYNTVIQIDEAY